MNEKRRLGTIMRNDNNRIIMRVPGGKARASVFLIVGVPGVPKKHTQYLRLLY